MDDRQYSQSAAAPPHDIVAERCPRAPAFALRVGVAMTALSLSTTLLAQSSGNSPTPPGVADDWSRGVWSAYDQSDFISGFKDEDDYQDPEFKIPHPAPFTPEYAARYNKIRQAAFNGSNTYDQGTNCSPAGIPAMSGFGLMEILFKAGQITMAYEEDGGVRRIFTDGRPHPADLEPTYNGHSIGHWEGKTLVVDTVGLRDDTYVEVGMPHSGKLHVIERWTQVGPNEMTNTVTLIDPLMLTKPWGTTWHWTRHPDWTVQEVVCLSSRDQKINGVTTMIGPDGKPLLGPKQKQPPPGPNPK
jgi:hypothetical protein